MYNMFVVIGNVKNILDDGENIRLIIESKALPNNKEKKMIIPVNVSKKGMYEGMKELLKKGAYIGVKGIVDSMIINNKLEAVLIAEKITITDTDKGDDKE